MIRNLAGLALVAAIAAVSVPVFAGGGSGSGNIPVRMKNVGSAPVGVNAVSGSGATAAQLQSGAKVIAANGIAQFSVRKGAFTAVAADPNAPLTVNKVRNFDTRTFKTIYLYAQQDTTTATLVGAPGGVKF
jgi:hypothetical protein